MRNFKKSLTGNIFFHPYVSYNIFFNVWKIMPKTGENKKPIQFPRKFHRSTGTSHFPGNVLFVDKIHRGDQCGCLPFFSNFLGILIRNININDTFDTLILWYKWYLLDLELKLSTQSPGIRFHSYIVAHMLACPIVFNVHGPDISQ